MLIELLTLVVSASLGPLSLQPEGHWSNPHESRPVGRTDRSGDASRYQPDSVGSRGSVINEGFDFDAIDGISARATLAMQDLDGDGVIRADGGYYSIYNGPSEVISLTIEFFENQASFAQYQIVSDTVISYPFLYFQWTIGSDTLESWDMGADPGVFCFGGPAVTASPGSYVADTERLLYLEIGQPSLIPPDPVQNVTQGTSFTSIQDAIDAALEGDRIEVSAGVYIELVDFLGKSIEVIGVDGPEQTAIDSGGSGPVVSFVNGESRGTLLEGFTITGASADGEPGMAVVADPTIRDCIVRDNVGDFGGGARVIGSPLFERVQFINNFASVNGGAVDDDFSGVSEYVNCLFAGNTALGNGGALHVFECSVIMVNCTIVGNSGGGGGGVTIVGDAEPQTLTLTNSVVWGNTGGDILELNQGSVFAFNSVFPGAISPNISGDPMFVDVSGADYRLSPGSPAIDAGFNFALDSSVVIDLDGNPRFIDDPATPDSGVGGPPTVDIGAYEFVPPPLNALCDADLDGNGSLQFFDIAMYVGMYSSGDVAADSDGNGILNFFDIAEFINSYLDGCVAP